MLLPTMPILAMLALAPALSVTSFETEKTRGWQGSGLAMVPDAVRYLDLHEPLSAQGGAIAFWVYPDPAQAQADSSYTLLSARWGGSTDSYLVVSQGWWEPLGRGNFYAVISNRDAAFCNAERTLEPRRWTQVVVSWRGTKDGFCRIYFDGAIVANRSIAINRALATPARLALGSDREATDRRGREARGTLDEFQQFSTSLSDAEVRTLYERDVPDIQLRHHRAFDWAKPFLSQARAKAIPTHETRALLDESWQWARSPADVQQLIDTARRAGFNVIVPCVWHGRGAAWPTKHAHVQSELATAITQFDPLQTLIEQAHRVGIEVHPWITVVRREDARYPEFFDTGTPDGAYDVQRREFREFMATLAQELASSYDIDGLNLDYIRAMGICRSESCVRSYALATGRNLRTDLAASKVAGPARDALERWQDAALRELVTDIRSRVRAARPHARLTVSGHPVPTDTLRALEGRAEVDWLKRGLIDAVFAMEYGALPRHATIAAVAAEIRQPSQIVWLFANFDRVDGVAVARPADDLSQYIRFARARTPGAGVAVYLRSMLNPAQSEALAKGPFRRSALPGWRATGPAR